MRQPLRHRQPAFHACALNPQSRSLACCAAVCVGLPSMMWMRVYKPTGYKLTAIKGINIFMVRGHSLGLLLKCTRWQTEGDTLF